MISSFVVKIDVGDNQYVLINTKNGSIIRVDAEALNAMEHDPHSLGDNEVEALKSMGFLVDEPDQDEMRQYFESLWNSVYRNNYHIMVVTYTCNLNCSYCYLRDRRLGADMTHEQIDSAFDAILSFDEGKIDGKKSEMRNIQLYGGEPLQKRLHGKIEYILERGSDEGYSFLIFTNAMDLEHYMPLLTSYKDNIVFIQTTIDGPREVHDGYRYPGAFDRVISNIGLAIEEGFNVALRTNVGKQNLSTIVDLAKFYVDKGWVDLPNVYPYLAPIRDRWGPCYFNPELSYEEILSLFKNKLITSVFGLFDGIFVKFREGVWLPQFYNCAAHYRQLFYDPYGDMYSCMSALRIRDLSIGRYHPKLELNDNYFKYRARNIFTLEKCRTCQYALICGGGCSYNAYLKTGDLMNHDCYSMDVLKEKFFRLFRDDDVVSYYFKHRPKDVGI